MLRHVVVVVGELLDMLLLEMARPNWADLLEPAEEQVSAGTPIFQVQRQALAQPKAYNGNKPYFLLPVGFSIMNSA